MKIQPKGFERTPDLRTLLSGIAPEKLSGALTALLGSPIRIVSADGSWVMGGVPALAGNVQQIPLIHDLETLGYLETPVIEKERIRAVVAILEAFMHSGARYLMASEMHTEVVHANYLELQRRHSALTESEARYKALAGNLKERVQEQVQTIETAHRQLYQAEKLASVGQLAAGMAHEINNPIGFIRSNLDTARSYVQKIQAFADQVKSSGNEIFNHAWQAADLDFILKDFSSLLQESRNGADRVARIVSDLKGFSNIDHAAEEIVDLNDCIRSACGVAANQIGTRATLKQELGKLPPLLCHAGHLRQVIFNLLLNAAQAMEKHGEILIRSTFEDNQIVVSVTDNGSGIPPEVLPRIFEPFYTTREVGSGTGLGLTVCRDIVTMHGGTIQASSELGVGTAVTIHLPVKQGNA